MIKLIVIAIAVFVEIAHSGYDMLIRNDVLQATVEMNSALLIIILAQVMWGDRQ